MKTNLKAAGILILYLISASCESVYFLKTTNIEVLVPAKVVFPEGTNKLAIRYNNSNVAFNSHFAEFLVNDKVSADTTNTDSISSEVYFRSFSERINDNLLFDSVSEIERGNYSTVCVSDSLFRQKYAPDEDSLLNGMTPAVLYFVDLTTKFQPDHKLIHKTKYIDPYLGLYSEKELSDISDSTGADMLLSLDFFAVLDFQKDAYSQTVSRYVFIITSWNFYDLNKPALPYFYNRVDTISWRLYFDPVEIPTRSEALIMASEISGAQFADFLVPNWIEVERVYYRPWKRDLRITTKLMAEGKWKEAAGYWRSYTSDKNKATAAWSMYNMALAAEMENQIDAAIDWLVRSYHLYGKKDQVHKEICESYLKVLSQRKLDIRQINVQVKRVPES